jgi:feruloyl-CoA synthase
VQDAVITGHDRSAIGVLLFASEAGRALPAGELATHVGRALRTLKEEHAGSSQTPTRALVLPDGPSAAAGEITDKGYVNQRLVLLRRAAEVERLYGTPADAAVILP